MPWDVAHVVSVPILRAEYLGLQDLGHSDNVVHELRTGIPDTRNLSASLLCPLFSYDALTASPCK